MTKIIMDRQSDSPFKSLHAYWRMPYIKSKTHCESASGAEVKANPFTNLRDADEEACHILIKGTNCCLLLNRYPYNAGHLLVLPYRVISDLSQLNKSERSEFMDMIIQGETLLTKALKPDGLNVGLNLGAAAGAGRPGRPRRSLFTGGAAVRPLRGRATLSGPHARGPGGRAASGGALSPRAVALLCSLGPVLCAVILCKVRDRVRVRASEVKVYG